MQVWGCKMKARDPILNIFMGVLVIVVSIGVVGIFNMSHSITRITEHLIFIDFRLNNIEQSQGTLNEFQT